MDILSEIITNFHHWLNTSNPKTVQEIKDYWEKLRKEYFKNNDAELELLGRLLYYKGD